MFDLASEISHYSLGPTSGLSRSTPYSNFLSLNPFIYTSNTNSDLVSTKSQSITLRCVFQIKFPYVVCQSSVCYFHTQFGAYAKEPRDQLIRSQNPLLV